MKQKVSKLVVAVVAVILLFGFESYAKESVVAKETKIQTNAFSYMCKDRIESLVKELKGVTDAFLSMEDRVITVMYDENSVKPNDMVLKIKEIGYEAELVTEPMNAENKDNKKSLSN